jgi:hypothetical protein
LDLLKELDIDIRKINDPSGQGKFGPEGLKNGRHSQEDV